MGACCAGCFPAKVWDNSGPKAPETHTVTVGGDKSQATEFVLPLHLEVIKKIGSGAYGCVVSCKDTRSAEGTKIAVKKVCDFAGDLVDGKRIFRELRLMQLLEHKQLLSIQDILAPPSPDFDDIYMVLPMMETDLHQVIYSKTALTDDHYQSFTYQILLGVAFLHSAKVAHRDLKPANILSDKRCFIKICDFGLARVMGEAEGGQADFQESAAAEDLTDYVVTRWYRAPEVILMETHYTLGIDLWSVGCILAELVKRKPLFPGRDSGDQIKKVVAALGTPQEEDISWIPANTAGRKFLTKHCANKPKAEWARLVPNATQRAVDLVSRLLVFSPEKRLTATDALQLPYFDDIRDPAEVAAAYRGSAIDGSFDNFKLTRRSLQNLVYHECGTFHPEIYERDRAKLRKAGIEAPQCLRL